MPIQRDYSREEVRDLLLASQDWRSSKPEIQLASHPGKHVILNSSGDDHQLYGNTRERLIQDHQRKAAGRRGAYAVTSAYQSFDQQIEAVYYTLRMIQPLLIHFDLYAAEKMTVQVMNSRAEQAWIVENEQLVLRPIESDYLVLLQDDAGQLKIHTSFTAVQGQIDNCAIPQQDRNSFNTVEHGQPQVFAMIENQVQVENIVCTDTGNIVTTSKTSAPDRHMQGLQTATATILNQLRVQEAQAQREAGQAYEKKKGEKARGEDANRLRRVAKQTAMQNALGGCANILSPGHIQVGNNRHTHWVKRTPNGRYTKSPGGTLRHRRTDASPGYEGGKIIARRIAEREGCRPAVRTNLSIAKRLERAAEDSVIDAGAFASMSLSCSR